MQEYQPLNDDDKKKFLHCFDLSGLSLFEKIRFRKIMLNSLEEFPILSMVARDMIDNNCKIKFDISDLDNNVSGEYYKNKIAYNKNKWKNSNLSNTDIASTIWHEITHALQDKKISYTPSKRGYFVHDQFIEAEAMSFSNLLSPRSNFEKNLYLSIKENSKSDYEAQLKYIAISTKFRLCADRELVEVNAKNIMKSRFNKEEFDYNEKNVINDWRDYYAESQSKRGHEKFIFAKQLNDNDNINKIEAYFYDKYGIKISPKSSITEECIKKYNLDKDIRNTYILSNDDEIFNKKHWRDMDAKNGNCYVLECPNMDADYVKKKCLYLKSLGINCHESFIKHRDGFSDRCIYINKSDTQSTSRFLEECRKYNPLKKTLNFSQIQKIILNDKNKIK